MTDYPVDEFDKAQVEDALAPWREWLPGKYPTDNNGYLSIEHAFPRWPGVERTHNLRLDVQYVLHDRDEVAVLSTEAVESILTILSMDLTDLLTNGDSQKVDDALLRHLDGTRKRGLHARQFQIPQLLITQQFRPPQGIIEYTVYLTPYIDWWGK